MGQIKVTLAGPNSWIEIKLDLVQIGELLKTGTLALTEARGPSPKNDGVNSVMLILKDRFGAA